MAEQTHHQRQCAAGQCLEEDRFAGHQRIAVGAHVHSRNLETLLSGTDNGEQREIAIWKDGVTL